MISRLPKFSTLEIGWGSWIKKMVNYLSCREGNGGSKDIQCSAQNAALFFDLL